LDSDQRKFQLFNNDGLKDKLQAYQNCSVLYCEQILSTTIWTNRFTRVLWPGGLCLGLSFWMCLWLVIFL